MLTLQSGPRPSLRLSIRLQHPRLSHNNWTIEPEGVKFDQLYAARWDAVVGDWSSANGVLTGTNPTVPNTSVGTLLLNDLSGSTAYEFEVELAGNSGGFSLYHSPGNGYTINTNRSVENLGVSYYVDGQAFSLHSVLLADLGLQDVIEAGQPVTFKIVRAGSEFTLSINGTEIYTFTDTLWDGDVEVGIRGHGSESYERAMWSHAVPGILGDLNGDGSVNGQDLAILAANFGSTGQTLATGDLTGDGNVNGQDLAILAANFGASGDIATVTNPDSAPGNEDAPGNEGGNDAPASNNNNDDDGDSPADGDANNNEPPAALAPLSRGTSPARPTRDAPITLTHDQQRAAATTPSRQTNALALAAPVANQGADTASEQADNGPATTPEPRLRRFDALALR